MNRQSCGYCLVHTSCPFSLTRVGKFFKSNTSLVFRQFRDPLTEENRRKIACLIEWSLHADGPLSGKPFWISAFRRAEENRHFRTSAFGLGDSMFSRLHNEGIVTGLSVTITIPVLIKTASICRNGNFGGMSSITRYNLRPAASTPGNGFEQRPELMGSEHITPLPSYEPGLPKGDFSTPIIIDRATTGSPDHGDAGRSIASFCSAWFSRQCSSPDSLAGRKTRWQNTFWNNCRNKKHFSRNIRISRLQPRTQQKIVWLFFFVYCSRVSVIDQKPEMAHGNVRLRFKYW